MKDAKLKEKPSARKREHSALQNKKFLNFFYFCKSFTPSWIGIQPTKINGSVSKTQDYKLYPFRFSDIVLLGFLQFASGSTSLVNAGPKLKIKGTYGTGGTEPN
jgi:hypothetical protein